MKNRAVYINVFLATGVFACFYLFVFLIDGKKVKEPSIFERRVWDVTNNDDEYWKPWAAQRDAVVNRMLENREGDLNYFDKRPEYIPTTAEEFLEAFYDPERKRDVYIERLGIQELRKVNARFREEYPIVSLEQRLAYEDAPGKLQQHGQRHQYDLSDMTWLLHDQWNTYYHLDESGNLEANKRPLERQIATSRSLRYQALKILHEEGINAFANVTYKFGFDRVAEVSQFYLYAQDPTCVDLPEDISKLMKGRNSLDDSQGSEGLDFKNMIESLQGDYPKLMHLAFYHQFTDDRAFTSGFRNAAGFEPHAVRDSVHWSFDVDHAPKDPLWQVERMELVGLLKHDQPVVYVSTMLPNMKQLAKGETRPLDKFETVALDKI